MKAASDTTRGKIHKMLQKKVMRVCEIQKAVGIAQSTARQHLKILEKAGQAGNNVEREVVAQPSMVDDGFDIVCSCPVCGFMFRNLLKRGAYYATEYQEAVGAPSDVILKPDKEETGAESPGCLDSSGTGPDCYRLFELPAAVRTVYALPG